MYQMFNKQYANQVKAHWLKLKDWVKTVGIQGQIDLEYGTNVLKNK